MKDRITKDRWGQSAHTLPTGPVDIPALLAAAARLGVPVARWTAGRLRVYRAGVEVVGWSPWGDQ